MPAPLSNDLRKRIVEARERGDTISKIAKEKNVSVSAINKLMALYRETGSYQPRALNNGRKPRLSELQLQAVRETIEQNPGISLTSLIEQLDLPVCPSALCRTINGKLGLKRKKNGKRV